ncbi:hypothetical protein [Kitasatospora sp. NPDC088134]|uniref:hypothetical protein n=1 Tax=Kitasatospora sp. NPDC088134 TaxID=3364071 RepID=UPI0037FA7150
MPAVGEAAAGRPADGGGGGSWCPLPDLDSVGEQLPHGGLGLVLVGVAGDEAAVLPDLVHVRGEVAFVEGDVQAAVVAGTGDAPAAGTHRGPRQGDVRSGAGSFGALALGLRVGGALALGRQLGLMLLFGAFAYPLGLGPVLCPPPLHLDVPLVGGLSTAGGFLAAGQRGQGLGLAADGPGLGEVGTVVLPDLEHGAAVGGGPHFAALVLAEEPGGEHQLDYAAAHPASLRVEPGSGRDEAVAGAVPPDPTVGVLPGGRRDEVVHAGRPPGFMAGLLGAPGGGEPTEVRFVLVGVEPGGELGVVAVGVLVADLGRAAGVPVAAGQAPDQPPPHPGGSAGADPDGTGGVQPPLQGGAAPGNPRGEGGGGGH